MNNAESAYPHYATGEYDRKGRPASWVNFGALSKNGKSNEEHLKELRVKLKAQLEQELATYFNLMGKLFRKFDLEYSKNHKNISWPDRELTFNYDTSRYYRPTTRYNDAEIDYLNTLSVTITEVYGKINSVYNNLKGGASTALRFSPDAKKVLEQQLDEDKGYFLNLLKQPPSSQIENYLKKFTINGQETRDLDQLLSARGFNNFMNLRISSPVALPALPNSSSNIVGNQGETSGF